MDAAKLFDAIEMTPVFRGQFLAGVFTLDAGEKEKLLNHCRSFKDGDGELIVRKKKKRSMPYHRYFFGVIVKMFAEYYEVFTEDAYCMLMQRFRPIVTDDLALRADGSMRFMGISKMNTKEMIDLGDEIRSYALHNLSLRIPEPNEIDIPDQAEMESQYS